MRSLTLSSLVLLGRQKLLHGLEVVPHEVLATQGVGGGELVESCERTEDSEVHGMTLVTNNDHVPGWTRLLAKLC